MRPKCDVQPRLPLTRQIFTGQADGLQSRTLETMDSFGLRQPILEANKMLEIKMVRRSHGPVA